MLDNERELRKVFPNFEPTLITSLKATPRLVGTFNFGRESFTDIDEISDYCRDLVGDGTNIPLDEEVIELKYALSDLYINRKIDLDDYQELIGILD